MSYPISHRLRLIITCIVTIFPVFLFARDNKQGDGTYSFGYVSLGGGYSNLSHEISQANVQGSFALLGGLGYEFRYNGFWMSVGAQYQLKRSTLTSDEYLSKNYPGIDDLGEDVTLSYRINQKDQHNWTSVDVPLLLGYYFKGFYVGAGAKVGFHIGSTISTSGTYELQGQYKFGLVRNFGYYTTYPYENKTTYSFKPEVALLGEIGYDLLSRVGSHIKTCHLLKLGFYCEYGLNSLRAQSLLDPITVPNNKDATVAIINPYILSTQTQGVNISNFVVGVKLTYAIGGSRSVAGTWHVGCQCYGD